MTHKNGTIKLTEAGEFVADYSPENRELTAWIRQLEAEKLKLEAALIELTAALIELTAPSQFIKIGGHYIDRASIAYAREHPAELYNGEIVTPCVLSLTLKCLDAQVVGPSPVVLEFTAGTPEFDAVKDWLYAQSDDLLLMRQQAAAQACDLCASEPEQAQ